MRQAMTRMMDESPGETPLDIAADVFEIVQKESGFADPYSPAKAACITEAREWLPILREKVQSSDDGLALAIKIAAIGNIMDYGALASFDVSAMLDQTEDHEFAVNDREAFEARLKEARTITYFLDNAGENVFDRVLIEYLTDKFSIDRVRLIVRDRPFLNDIWMGDVVEYEIDKWPKVEVLPLAVTEKRRDPETWKLARSSDIILAKGMANYESYSEYDNFHFLFIVKCALVAGHVSERTGRKVSKGDLIFGTSRALPEAVDGEKARSLYSSR